MFIVALILLNNTEIVGKRGAFPLKYEHAASYTSPSHTRIALVGDAAHTVHPMAGQGVNLGVADAYALLASIAQAARVGDDIGSINVLKDYERRRKIENKLMMMGVDTIKRAFSLPTPFNQVSICSFFLLPSNLCYVKVVSSAISLLNRTPLKHAFMKMARGSITQEDVKRLSLS